MVINYARCNIGTLQEQLNLLLDKKHMEESFASVCACPFFCLLSNKIFFIAQGHWASLMQRRCCASLQQYGFAIAVISTALKPNPCLRDAVRQVRRRLTHELV